MTTCKKCKGEFKSYVQWASHDCAKHLDLLKRLRVTGGK
jgi:hypothetical protein